MNGGLSAGSVPPFRIVAAAGSDRGRACAGGRGPRTATGPRRARRSVVTDAPAPDAGVPGPPAAATVAISLRGRRRMVGSGSRESTSSRDRDGNRNKNGVGTLLVVSMRMPTAQAQALAASFESRQADTTARRCDRSRNASGSVVSLMACEGRGDLGNFLRIQVGCPCRQTRQQIPPRVRFPPPSPRSSGMAVSDPAPSPLDPTYRPGRDRCGHWPGSSSGRRGGWP